MNYKGKLCPWGRRSLLLQATAFRQAEDIGLMWSKEWRLQNAPWESSGLYLNQTTGKKEVLLIFSMSPTRWQKEDGVQGRQKEELGLIVGCWHTDCTLFLRVREEFWHHWKDSGVVWVVWDSLWWYRSQPAYNNLSKILLAQASHSTKIIPDLTIWLNFYTRRAYEPQRRSLVQQSKSVNSFF